MPPTSADHFKQAVDVLQSVQLLPDEAKAPILHYRRTVAEISGLLSYVARMIGERDRYQGVVDRHLGRLHGMVLINLVETFERYLKEIAADCVDCLANLIIDNRFDVFNKIQGSNLASHFQAGTLGKALCESTVWLDCADINDRFRKILADAFKDGTFYVFPKTGSQEPKAGQWRYEIMSLVWQLRHTSVHNVGVITQSDAVKMRVLSKANVDAPRMLVPSKKNLLWLKMFLDETAEDCNQRIGRRLSELLTAIHAETPALIQPQDFADKIASIFRIPLQVAAAAGVVPPD